MQPHPFEDDATLVAMNAPRPNPPRTKALGLLVFALASIACAPVMVQGPPGPIGPPGPVGSPGAAGPEGSAAPRWGKSDVEWLGMRTLGVGADGTSTAKVSCKRPQDVMLSGSCQAEGGAVLVESGAEGAGDPTQRATWSCKITVPKGTKSPAVLASAFCLKVP